MFQPDAAADSEDISLGKYGFLDLIHSKSSDKAKLTFVNIKEIVLKNINKNVWIRGRMHTSRAKGNA